MIAKEVGGAHLRGPARIDPHGTSRCFACSNAAVGRRRGGLRGDRPPFSAAPCLCPWHATLITFVLTPLVKRLEQWRIKRGIAVCIVVSLSLAVAGGIGYGGVLGFSSKPSSRRKCPSFVKSFPGSWPACWRG